MEGVGFVRLHPLLLITWILPVSPDDEPMRKDPLQACLGGYFDTVRLEDSAEFTAYAPNMLMELRSCGVHFSPGDGEFLLVASDRLDGNVVVLESKTLEEPPWGRYLRVLTQLAGSSYTNAQTLCNQKKDKVNMFTLQTDMSATLGNDSAQQIAKKALTTVGSDTNKSV